MNGFNRFGNMSPTEEYVVRPYLMDCPPFRIGKNLYFVGNLWCSSHLIDTGEGLILLDTPVAGNLPGLLNNIWTLGFQPKDIKYIIVSHAHTDHYGAVGALVHMTGAKTFLSVADAKDMRENKQRIEAMNREIGAYNESFIPDVELEDGAMISLGNTNIRCVLTPGHTIGVMSHFWTMEDGGRTYRVGIYGGAGFVTVSRQSLERNHQPLSLQEDFLSSIEKVWDEPVDIMLGNHPFHNDTYQKHRRVCRGEVDAFIDPHEWQRFLGELKICYERFLVLRADEVEAMYKKSQIMDYYGDLVSAPTPAQPPHATNQGGTDFHNESA